MRKLVMLLGGVATAVIAVAAVIGRPTAATAQAKADPNAAVKLAAADTANLKGPRQPVFFRHDIHASQYKIQCQYCHYSVAVASEPGLPSTQTCMGCHLVIGGSDESAKAEIKKVRDSWQKKEPIQWVRIHYLAKHAHFPHQRHIKAMGPNACATCHGDVSRMVQVYKVNNIQNMGWCISCHLERKVTRDCSACHY
ncbi:MAG: cytochrome c3 family protein [Gemmatimonadales bacterium]|nr:cytochrome c3 family protein [Gemmatimonadales bacterium]